MKIHSDGMILREVDFKKSHHPWFGDIPTVGEDYCFAVIGDRTGMQTPGFFHNGISLVAALKPDFMVCVGDLVEGYYQDHEKDRANRDWRENIEFIESLEVPFFTVVGNHDYGNDLQIAIWREHLGFEYYAFRLRESLFLMMNTVEGLKDSFDDSVITLMRNAESQLKLHPEQEIEIAAAFSEKLNNGETASENLDSTAKMSLALSDTQFGFFERVLLEHQDVRHIYVVTHLPFWKGDGGTQFERFMALINKKPFTIIAGHLHALEYSQTGQGEFVQVGRTGGACWEGAHKGNFNQVLWVDVHKGEPHFTVIPATHSVNLKDYTV